MRQLLAAAFSRKSHKSGVRPRQRRLSLENLEDRRLLTAVSIIPTKDNSIYSGYVNNSNAQGDLYTGLNNDGTNIKRALMKFDIAAAVPAGATINSVTLGMYCVRDNNGGNSTVELHKLLQDWGEGTSMAGTYAKSGGKGTAATTNDATWLKSFYNTTAWASPGGYFSPTASGSTLVLGPNGTGAYTWSSTAGMVADVQNWLNTPGTNFGWLLKASATDETVNTSHAFYPREWTTASQRPTLTINYTVTATNQPPTLAAIANPAAINENAGLQTVNLSGITAGAGDTQQLQVTAASDNTALIPNPTVAYTSPATTGSLSYTPVAYKYGTAHVTVTVRDAGLDGTLGTADDGTVAQTFTVTVNQVNQPPTLTAIANPAAINENAGLQTVNLSGITAGTGDTQQLQVTAASDNTALIPNPTVNYTSPAATGSLSYTPVAYKYGTAHVTVTVRDAGLDGTLGNGDDATVAQTFTVTVNQVNQLPTLAVITDPAAINENAGLQTVSLSGITAGPGDTQPLQVTAASDNTALIPNPTVAYTSPAATGSLSYTPVASQYGTAHVTVTVRDAGLDGTLGNTDDATFARTFTVVVNSATPVNQPPTLNPIPNPAPINANAGLQTINLSGITAGPGETQALRVTAASDNTALIPNPTVSYTSPNTTGSISYTPVASQFGTAHVTVTVRDAGLDGTLGNTDDATFAQTFTVVVNSGTPVNQPPTLNAIPNPAAINANAGLQTVNLSGITAGPGESQALQVTAASDNTALIPNPTVSYTSPAATGSISYAPVADKYGTAHVTVTVRDAGLDGTLGNADDATFARTFTVVVNSVNPGNQPPTLDAIADPAPITENARRQTVKLTGITAGPGESQRLQVTATSDNTSLIPVPQISYRSPNATASLSYRPVINRYGTAHVTVTVRDAGLDRVMGNADDATFARTFTVVVNTRGNDTPGLYDERTSSFQVRSSNSTGPADHSFGYGSPNSGWVPLAGDWNGDGSDTVGFYDPATSVFALRDSLSAGYADETVGFGAAGQGWIPLVGDWNGDGIDTIGSYDPAASVFYLRNSLTSGTADITFGYGSPAAGWMPLAGDWDGNGIDTVGFYDPRSATFSLRNSNNSGCADLIVGFGQPGSSWKPVVGDWAGTGSASVGLYDPAASMFYLAGGNATGYAAYTFGYGQPGAGWIPISGAWNSAAGLPLKAADGVATATQPGTPLTESTLRPIVNAALARWAAAGIPSQTLAAMQATQVVVSDLGGPNVGLARAGSIVLDRDAAGHGWFVDPTPAKDEEFARLSPNTQLRAVDPRAVDRMDLLTVVEHELGHVAGLDDLALPASSLMAGKLSAGLRRLPGVAEVDAVLRQAGDGL